MLDKPNNRVIAAVIVALLAFIVQLPLSACPADNNQPKTKQQSDKVTNKPTTHSLQNPCHSPHTEVDDYHWMEQLHQTVSDSVFQSAMWFDNFFLDENSEQESPKVTAKIRFGWEPKARDWSEFDTRFRVKVKLPHFKDRVDIILSDDDDINQSQLPLETVNSRPDDEDEHFAAAVRYTHNRSDTKLLESRIGISGGDIFVKTKHKRRFNWHDINSIKIEPSVYYFLDDGLGAKLLLEYDYQATQRTQYRINYSVRVSESFSGLRWKHGFYKLTQLQQNAATITAFQVEGERNGKRGFIIDKYTLSYRYRFNALKSWLFFEVEPFLEWPEKQHYSTTPGIALRVEGFFSKG
ncbi:hypothetical protein tinsulaeT_17920 [Thalassotalea insulae]|uniref:Uncharacterized protein n=1 Tax=Thalassotalea insulae TaxID=2056778 RepID=A0ABQ6GUW9_9GAMM|nr:hypothetical protein [Thalassotalea insulae]GLX78452.1 hypothetical protein tinsulaeT_17920 [Thalassotalea insulae]